MEFFELIKNRYSVRSYKSDIVEQEKLDKILEAANLAPTAANRQAFKIVIINTKGKEEQLKKIYSRDFFIQAPIIIGIYTKPDKCWVRSDSKNYSDVDAAIVMDHIILAAAAQGLGTCWVGAFNPEEARAFTAFGDDYEPVAFTPVGYAENNNFKKVRKTLEDIVVYL